MTQARGGFYQQKIIPAPFPLKKSVLLMGCALAALHVPAHAQEISGANAAAATVITDNTAVTDTTQGGGTQYGEIDANGGTFNVPSITTGTDDGVATTTRILIIDSVTGGDVVTVDGDVTINTGAVNPDDIEFYVGNSTLSTGVDFNGNFDAGNGGITFTTSNVTNPDTITFSGQTINLGTGGGIYLTNATDTVTFDGAAAQTMTGSVGGLLSRGKLIVNNAAGVTFINGVGTSSGLVYHIDTMTIAGSGTDSAATLMADSYTANGITLGDGAGSDTNTLTFDTSNNDFTLYSDVTGTAGDTDNIVIQGGGTFTLDSSNDVDVDNITITGNGTIFDDQNDNLHTVWVNDTMTIGSGATLKISNQAGITVVNGITNNGIIQFADSADVLYGTVTGGHFDVDAFGSATDSNINIDTMDIATGASFSFGTATTVTVGQTTLNGTAELGLSRSNFTGDVVAATSGDGVVTVADVAATQTITGNIGEAGKTVGTFRINDSSTNANLVQMTGNLYVDTITIGASDTLQLLGSSAQTVSGNITGSGTLKVGNGSTASNVTFSGAVTGYAGDFNVMNKATATLANAFTTSGNLSVDGNLTVKQGVNATVADVIAGSAQGKLYLTVGTDSNGNDTSATLFDTGGALDFANLNGTNANTATLTLKPGTGVVTVGQEFLIIDGATTVANFTNGTLIADDFALFDFTLYDGATATLGTDDSDIVATVGLVDLAAVTSSVTNADTLDAFIGNVTAAMVAADPILESVYNSVLSNPDPDNAAESIQAAIDGGLVIAANNFAADNNNINNLRLAALRTGSGVTGMAAGDELVGMKVWTQAFGKMAEQDRRDNVNGFDLDSYGVAFGADKELDAFTIGLAFSYGNSEVDSKNATTTNTDIDSYQLSLYGDYDIGNAIYISGSAYYAYHDIETTRHDVGGVSGLNASGDFSANQFGARIEVGRDYKRGATLITPKVLTNISHYDADSYTETGAGGASLNVDSDAVDVVELGVGVDAKWSLQQNNGAVLEPTLSAEYHHDFIGDEVETNSSFTGTGASFQTKGFDPAQDTVNLGASVTYFSADNWELSAHYDYGVKSDYAAHSGFVKVAYKF